METVRRYTNTAGLADDLSRAVTRLAGKAAQRLLDVSSRDISALLPFKLDQRLDAETLASLVADYESGTPTTQLTGKYGLGKGSVLRLLRECGAKIRQQGVPDDEIATASQLYLEGWSLSRLGKRYGCDLSTVRNTLRRNGIEMRPRPGWSYDT